MKTFKYLAGVAGVGIIVLLLYVWAKPNNSSSTYTKTQPPPASQGTNQTSNENQSTTTTPAPIAPATSVDSTGIVYDDSYKEPAADVTAQFNLGSGAGEQQTVTAKKGQRVRITFTANFRDEVKIDGYNASDNVEPMREDAISFIVDKTGSFPIRLIKANKIVGTLKVE